MVILHHFMHFTYFGGRRVFSSKVQNFLICTTFLEQKETFSVIVCPRVCP